MDRGVIDTANETTPHGHDDHNHGHPGPHLDQIINSEISRLAPYSGLILVVCLVIVFAVRFYIFETFLMRKIYGAKYTAMYADERVRRGFINHHVAGMIKIILLVTAAYPFMAVAFGSATMHSSFDGHGGRVTMGDVLVVCSQLFISMYVFELFYRPQISPIGALHHIGAIVIAQSAVAISLDFEHEVDATIEFVMCFVWGAFDVLAEFWPHLAIILYRIYNDDHVFLIKVFRTAVFTEVAGTTLETIVVMWLFAGLWDRWTLPFKVVTPILHALFSAAQLWGAYNFWQLWKKQEKLLAEKKQARELPK